MAKNESISALASRRVIEDLDKTWEAIHPYESCGVDTFILTYAHFYPYDYYENRRSDKELQAFSLLNDRYRELNEQDNALGMSVSGSPEGYLYQETARDKHYDMIDRIRQEWMNRYFLPRVESLAPEDYESFLHAKIVHTDLKDMSDPLDPVGRNGLVASVAANAGNLYRSKSYRALADLAMVPLYGGRAVHLLVPPHVDVTGELGHSKVTRWSDVETHDGAYDTLRQEIGRIAHAEGYSNRLHAARLELG